MAYAIIMGITNDRRKRDGVGSVEECLAKKGKVHVWPYLVWLEMLCVLVVSIVLIVWSITLDAPLEELADTSRTPNPSKAPWYFRALQEMLVYFDPVIAGVVLPGLIVLGLMAIPYIDINREGIGQYTLSGRKWAIATFCFGFWLWIVLIIIGTFMRGPGWMWFWPWEEWDPHRIVAMRNIDLSDFFFRVNSKSLLGSIIGFLVVGGYYFLTMAIPYLILRKRGSEYLKKLGFIRYILLSFLFWTMMALPIKIILRLTMSIKYVWVTPWFNI
jgi:uncharacterized membrane protein